MRALDLLGGKKSQTPPTKGVEVPGTISIYLVKCANGEYYKGEPVLGDPVTTESWTQAMLFTSFAGMLQAKEIAARLHGEVYIVSCTPPEPYRG